MNPIRRVLALSGLTLLLAAPAAADPSETVAVYRSPSCGCCWGWVDHLKQAGFTVETHQVFHHYEP